MEDLPRNLSKNVKRLSEPRTARRSSRWTLLLVDENGRTIRVRGFRLLVALAVVLILGLAAAGGAAFHLLRMERAENRRLRAAVASSAEVIRGGPEIRTPATPATDETETASPTARTPETTDSARSSEVETDAASPDELATAPFEPSAETPADASPEAPATEPPAAERPAVPPERVFSAAPAETTGDAETPSGPPQVAVERVAFPEEDGFAVGFRLANVAPDTEKVAGHVVVVLRLAGGGYAALPEVPLAKGRPTGKVEGESFSIRNYRPMRFQAEPEVDGDRVRGATAFVYDSDGRLLLETPLNADPK